MPKTTFLTRSLSRRLVSFVFVPRAYQNYVLEGPYNDKGAYNLICVLCANDAAVFLVVGLNACTLCVSVNGTSRKVHTSTQLVRFSIRQQYFSLLTYPDIMGHIGFNCLCIRYKLEVFLISCL